MVVLRHIEHPHSPIVSTDIVQCLHYLKRVAQRLRLLQSLAVHAQRIVETALVAHQFSHLSISNDATQHIALTLHALLYHGDSVNIVRRGHYAVQCLAFGKGNPYWFLSTRNQHQAHNNVPHNSGSVKS